MAGQSVGQVLSCDPDWHCRLPGFPFDKVYGGSDPHGFMQRNQITAYLDAFAASFTPEIREHTNVSRVAHHKDGGFVVEASAGVWACDQVAIATGSYDKPIEPTFAVAPDPTITQMHSVIIALPRNCRTEIS